MRLSSWRFIRFPCLRPQQQEQQSPRHASSQRRPSSKRFFRSSHQRPACEENLSMFKCCISSFGSTRSGFFGRADVTAGTSACTQCQMCQMGASAMPPTRISDDVRVSHNEEVREASIKFVELPQPPRAITYFRYNCRCQVISWDAEAHEIHATWRCVFEASFRGRRSKRTASNHCILSSTPLAYSSLDVRFQLPARSRNATPRYVVAACRYNALHAFVLPMLTRAVSDGCLTAMHCSVYAQVTRAACNQGLGHGLLRGTPYG